MLVEKFRRTNPATVDTIAGAETVPVLSISLSSKPSERRIYAQLLSSSGVSLRHAMTLVEMEVRALLILKQLKAVRSRKEQITDEDVESWKPALEREAVFA